MKFIAGFYSLSLAFYQLLALFFVPPFISPIRFLMSQLGCASGSASRFLCLSESQPTTRCAFSLDYLIIIYEEDFCVPSSTLFFSGEIPLRNYDTLNPGSSLLAAHPLFKQKKERKGERDPDEQQLVSSRRRRKSSNTRCRLK